MSEIEVDRGALVRLFREEADEGLAAMEQALLALEHGPGRAETLQTLFREAHTLKGNAAMLGLDELAQVTHEVEDVLARLRAGRLEATRQVIDLLLASVDSLRELLGQERA